MGYDDTPHALIDNDIAGDYFDIMSRTVVNLRDDLVERARRLTGLKRKVEIVNAALQALVDREEAYRALRALRGQGGFSVTGDQVLRERHGSRR